MLLLGLPALAYHAPTDPASALFPMEEYTIPIPDTVPVKVQNKIKELLPWILQGMAEAPSKEVQDRMAEAAAVAYRESLKPPATVCSSSLQPGTRLLLTAFVAEGFHGSTALQQALMSANNVGTLCGGDNYECEAVIDERRCEICTGFDRPASALPCMACAAPPQKVANGTEAFRANLELFEPYWMAQPTKQVLVVKWAPIWPGNAEWDILGGGTESTPAFDLEEIETTTVPKGMAASGVTRVSWGVVIMHRPWCMWSMSSHARNAREEDLKVWATRELFLTEKLVAYHRKHALNRIPVLVTSYAQLMWRPADFVKKVRFSPGACSDLYPALPAHTTGAHLCTHTHAGEALCPVCRQRRPPLCSRSWCGHFRGKSAQNQRQHNQIRP